MESLKEISQFLNLDTRLDLQAVAVENILGLTNTSKCREMLLSCPEILRQFILLCQVDSQRLAVAKDAARALINISGDEVGAKALLLISEASKCELNQRLTDNLIYICFSLILNKDNNNSHAP